MTLRRISIIFLVLYAMLTIYSIVSLLMGAMPWSLSTPITTLAGFTFALLYAMQREGWKKALLFLASVFVISILFESVGVATGLVYGPYHYTDQLGPKFLGLVPFLIPVAWFMMSYPSFVIADRLVPSSWQHWKRLLAVAALGGLAMTAWDVVMDPIMVASGNWVWEVNGAYHGIPLQNFWGWWLTVFTSFAIYLLISRKLSGMVDASHDHLPMISYSITALGIVIISLITRAGELALIGFFTMVPWILAGMLRLNREQ